MIEIIQLADTLGEAIILGTAFLAAIYIAIVFHEIAHGYVALLNGDDTAKIMGRLSLNPAKHFNVIGFLMLILVGFGFAKPVPITPSKFHNYKKGVILVSIAGVLTNLVLAFLLTPLQHLVADINLFGMSAFWLGFWQWVYYFLLFAILINLNIAAFNLLPLAPLDGFNLLAAVTRPQNRFVEFLRRYSIFILLVLFMLTNVNQSYSPLSIYLNFCNTGMQWLYNKFWALLGL
ncbi:MAG TPA: site-2 protease family protein [Clostridia bacterium]|nr:site-2 protease family protein [Clostridia bacterium]